MKQRIRLSPASRRTAIQAVNAAPDGYYVSIQEATRNLQQNARMWAMLGDIAKQIPWQINGVMGLQAPEDWKDIFSSALHQEQRIAQGLRGGFVMMGRRTSDMTIREMSDLIELMFAFGAENNIIWSEETVIPGWHRKAA